MYCILILYLIVYLLCLLCFSLTLADSEMDFAKTSGIFDKQIVNDDFEGAYHELVAFALGE